jgi:hypothetical protein
MATGEKPTPDNGRDCSRAPMEFWVELRSLACVCEVSVMGDVG